MNIKPLLILEQNRSLDEFDKQLPFLVAVTEIDKDDDFIPFLICLFRDDAEYPEVFFRLAEILTLFKWEKVIQWLIIFRHRLMQDAYKWTILLFDFFLENQGETWIKILSDVPSEECKQCLQFLADIKQNDDDLEADVVDAIDTILGRFNFS